MNRFAILDWNQLRCSFALLLGVLMLLGSATAFGNGAEEGMSRPAGLEALGLYGATSSASGSSAASCIDFEDIVSGTTFTPGDEFTSGGFRIEVKDGGGGASASVTVDSTTFASNLEGNSAATVGATLRLTFRSTQPGLTFRYAEAGGSVDLGVNGTVVDTSNFEDLDGMTIGGATVNVRVTSTSGNRVGFVTVKGGVDALQAGGQEVGLDNICPGCITFEDLPTGTTYAQGSSVSTGGVQIDLEQFDSATNGEMTIQDDTLNAFHLGNKAFTNNVLLSPQFSSPPDTLTFLYENAGGTLELRINNDLRSGFSDFASLSGQTVGGVKVRVNSLPATVGANAGLVVLTGQINDFAVGGQELYLDDICTNGRVTDEGAVFTVNSTEDRVDTDPGDGECDTGDTVDGNPECTLRAAIQETNARTNDPLGPDEIHFNIGEDGPPHRIQPQEALPDVTDPVVIDGSTEPDFSGSPVVAVDGSAFSVPGPNLLNLETGSDGSSVLALSLINSPAQGLFAQTDDHLIDGCWIGLAPDGTVAGITSWGIRIFGSNNQIGDPNGSGNVIVGADTGIDLSNDDAPGNVVQNNLIGETPGGTQAGNTFGITTGGGGGGIDNKIGGVGPAEGNRVAHNSNGVIIRNGIDNEIRGNRIFDNGSLGIDLDNDGQTPNDAGDGDDGANRLQNFPEIQNADYDGSANEVTVTYQVPSDPNESGSGASAYDLTIDFYRADADEEEGEAYLGTDTYTTSDYNTSTSGPDAKTVTITPPGGVSLSKSDHVVATATDDNGNTSEFSAESQQLPVELASFEAAQTGKQAVELTWTTASETNNAGFRVEHKAGKDGAWEKVGFVEGQGTTSRSQSYRFTAEELGVGTHEFRLKQRDLDGTTTAHDPVTVDLQMQEALRLSAPAPNPVQDRAAVSFAVKEQAEATIILYNTLGQQVRTVYRGSPTPGEAQTTGLSTDGLSSGVYFLRLRTDGQMKTRRVTVVK